MYEIKKICSDLVLPTGDRITQDWAYELPDEYRTKEWLVKYTEAYLNNNYPLAIKSELMTLCLDVINDLISSGVSPSNEEIIKTLNVLQDNYKNHIDIINYWASEGEPLEDCFALTPEMRMLKSKLR